VPLGSDDATRLFGSDGTRTAALVLRDLGGTGLLQLPGYTISQATTISLSNGTVSMGAVHGGVYLDKATSPSLVAASAASFATLPAPEPEACTLAALSLLLGVAAKVRKKLL
jgi:hypothetical protein